MRKKRGPINIHFLDAVENRSSMLCLIRKKKNNTTVLGWKQLLTISFTNQFAVLPLFFFSAFPHGTLFLQTIAISLSSLYPSKMMIASSYCSLTSMLCAYTILSPLFAK